MLVERQDPDFQRIGGRGPVIMNKSRTIRELGGEIWSELRQHFAEDKLDWKLQGRLVDTIMAILARHEGATLTNDKDLPVEPLPFTEVSGEREGESR